MRGEGDGSLPAGFPCRFLYRSAAFARIGGDKIDLKNPPHLESVVEVNRDEAEVWGRRRRSVDESKMRVRFGQLKGAAQLKDHVSTIARQLAPSPMMLFAVPPCSTTSVSASIAACHSGVLAEIGRSIF
jgi:hypothetical protein